MTFLHVCAPPGLGNTLPVDSTVDPVERFSTVLTALRRPAAYPRITAALALVLALVVSALVAAPAHAANGQLTGLVKTRTNGTTSVLSGAHVVLDRLKDGDDFFTDSGFRSTHTNAQGRYTFPNLPKGRYEMRVYPSREGLGYEYYDNKWSPYGATRLVVNGNKVTAKDVVLEPVGWFTGKVVDEAGRAIPGTSIGIRDGQQSGGYGFQAAANGTFDSRNGTYTKNLIPGRYLLEASAWSSDIEAPVYASTEVWASATPNTETKVPTFTLKRLKTVVVTVRDTNGTPLANAPIELFVQRNGSGAFEPPQYGPNETDENGKYRFVSGVANYKFRVHPPRGYQGAGVAEYWDGGDGAYAYKDAATISFGASEPMKRTITVQLGPAPTIKAPTPTVAGSIAVGRTVTARTGTWTPSAVRHSYQWLKNGVVIPNQKASRLKITAPIANGLKNLSVRITGELAGEAAVDNTSTQRQPTLRAVRPRIKGTKKVGKKLIAVPGKWRPGKVTYTYQWLRNGKPIKTKAAKKKQYRLVKKDRGKRISVRVTGKKPFHVSVIKVSKRTAKIKKR